MAKHLNLKPQSLSVGNWVKFEGQNVRIGFVSEKFICYYTATKDNSVAIEHIEPIPITTEILEMFGEYVHLANIWVIDKIGIIQIGNEFFYSWDKQIPIKYIHQLQNLYFLVTGDDLDIRM